MQDGVDGAGDFDVTRDVLAHESEFRMRKQMSDVRVAAGDEVVHAENVPASFEEQIAKMRAEKTGAACDDRAQIIFSLREYETARNVPTILSPDFFRYARASSVSFRRW